MNWNTLDGRLVERARARSCSQSLLDLLIPIEDWPRCVWRAGRDDAYFVVGKGIRVWWWCTVCNLPVRRAGVPDCGPKTLRE